MLVVSVAKQRAPAVSWKEKMTFGAVLVRVCSPLQPKATSQRLRCCFLFIKVVAALRKVGKLILLPVTNILPWFVVFFVSWASLRDVEVL